MNENSIKPGDSIQNIDRKYTKDSLLFCGYDPFIDTECTREASKIIEKYIIAVISEEHYRSIKEKLWIKIYFRVNGDVIDVIFPFNWGKWVTKEDKLLIEKEIKYNKLKLDCSALKTETYPSKKIIIWSLPITCGDNKLHYK